jgi:small-conductance mechanosensitive channel
VSGNRKKAPGGRYGKTSSARTPAAARPGARASAGPTEPELYFHTFGEFSLNLIVILRVDEFFDQYRLRHLFMKRLLARYEEEGIRIPFPIREFEMELTDETDRGPGRLSRPGVQESPMESDAISFDPPGRES